MQQVEAFALLHVLDAIADDKDGAGEDMQFYFTLWDSLRILQIVDLTTASFNVHELSLYFALSGASMDMGEGKSARESSRGLGQVASELESPPAVSRHLSSLTCGTSAGRAAR
jgi:hypothetical protein